MKKHATAALLVVATLSLLASCGGAGGGSQEGGSQEGGNQGSAREETGTTSQQAQRDETQLEDTNGGMAAGMDHSEMDHGSMGGEEMARHMLEGPNGEYSDERFIDMMVPHHQGAIEMAEVALKNAEHEEILQLSNDIIRTQRAEIEELEEIKREEFGTSEVTMRRSDEEMRGMGMMMEPQQLAEADPFDRAFIDNMIPHHQSAIDMANVVLDESENPRLRELAEAIVEAQEREIAQMERWREQWYPEG